MCPCVSCYLCFPPVTTSLTQLFEECWPDVAFPSDCSIPAATYEDQDDLADVVDIVTRTGARAGLVRRLRAEHPADRPHHAQYDSRLWDAMTEAVAAAWATERELGTPRFCFVAGTPDLEIPGFGWVEVKCVHLSDNERATVRAGLAEGNGVFSRFGTMSRDVDPALYKKLNDAWDNALMKFERVDQLHQAADVVWMRVGGFDWPLSPRRARTQLISWAEEKSRHSTAGLVLVYGWNWREPEFEQV